MSKPITAIIVGAGHRAMIYSSYALDHPEDLQIVGVADPNPIRRQHAMEIYGFSEDMCFPDAFSLAQKGKLADAIINGTMDTQHVATSLPLLAAGYDILLEKPFAVNEEEMSALAHAAQENKNTVMICHVLRYAPFYKQVKDWIEVGEIGDIISLEATEHVSYHHLAVSYIRGKWGNEAVCGTPMILSKCCHDLDLLLWLNNKTKPSKVASFGSDFQFDEKKKPQGAGTRCLVDCSIEPQCLYSAKKHYLDHPDRWAFYVWDQLEHLDQPTLADKEEFLKTSSPHGQCVWSGNHTVVDHQTVSIEFANGSTATLNMIGGTAKAERSIHIIGTKGEICGIFDDSLLTLRKIDTAGEAGYSRQVVDLQIDGDKSGMTGSHGGGDLRLVEDFVSVLQGQQPSISYTSLEDSMLGHEVAFAAERARKSSSVQNLLSNLS